MVKFCFIVATWKKQTLAFLLFYNNKVFFGRPMLWGLACGGQQGARAVLEMMKREIDQALALAGIPAIILHFIIK